MAAFDGDPLQRRMALEEFCRSYWQPLYFYARRRGCSPEDAEDRPPHTPSPLHVQGQLGPHPSKAIS